MPTMPASAHVDPSRTVYVVEPDDAARAALVAALEAAGCPVVGEEASGEFGVLQAAERHPALVVTRLDLPGLDGIEVTRSLASALPACRVVLVADGDVRRRLLEALEAGAAGYLDAATGPAAIAAAVARVADGGTAILPVAGEPRGELPG